MGEIILGHLVDFFDICGKVLMLVGQSWIPGNILDFWERSLSRPEGFIAVMRAKRYMQGP